MLLATCSLHFRAFRCIECFLLLYHSRRRAFYDKRVSQEVDGEALGEVRLSWLLAQKWLH